MKIGLLPSWMGATFLHPCWFFICRIDRDEHTWRQFESKENHVIKWSQHCSCQNQLGSTYTHHTEIIRWREYFEWIPSTIGRVDGTGEVSWLLRAAGTHNSIPPTVEASKNFLTLSVQIHFHSIILQCFCKFHFEGTNSLSMCIFAGTPCNNLYDSANLLIFLLLPSLNIIS